MLRTDEALKQRSAKATQIMAIIFLICFFVIGAWLYFGQVPGYSYAVAIDPNAALNPLAKEVVTNSNLGWMNNYSTYPITKVAPVL
ncbi:cytochrome d ubiquinol oxidase subunit 2, partial [Acinetobacter baumannii]